MSACLKSLRLRTSLVWSIICVVYDHFTSARYGHRRLIIRFEEHLLRIDRLLFHLLSVGLLDWYAWRSVELMSSLHLVGSHAHNILTSTLDNCVHVLHLLGSARRGEILWEQFAWRSSSVCVPIKGDLLYKSAGLIKASSARFGFGKAMAFMVLSDAIDVVSAGLIKVKWVVGWIGEIFGATWITWFWIRLNETALAEDWI